MLKLGIIAEGLPDSDVIIISELIKKILSDDLFFYRRPGKDKGNVRLLNKVKVAYSPFGAVNGS